MLTARTATFRPTKYRAVVAGVETTCYVRSVVMPERLLKHTAGGITDVLYSVGDVEADCQN